MNFDICDNGIMMMEEGVLIYLIFLGLHTEVHREEMSSCLLFTLYYLSKTPEANNIVLKMVQSRH